ATNGFPNGYGSSVVSLALSGSGVPNQVCCTPVITGASNSGFVVGKTFKEINQRQIATLAWGQSDTGFQRGGLRYSLDDQDSDASAIGWFVLAFLDGSAFGVTVPAFVPTQLANVISTTSCTNPPTNTELSITYDSQTNGTGSCATSGIFSFSHAG